MSTSTPPAWHWRDECAVPLATDPCSNCGGSHKPWVLCHEYAQMREEALSIDPRKLPDSAGLRVQNDSNPDPTYQDCWPSERYPSDGPAAGDQCRECRCAPGQPHAPGCAGVQGVRETPTNLRVGARNEHPACDVSKMGNFPVTGNITATARKTTSPADSCVASCGSCADTVCADILPEGELRNAAPPCAYYRESPTFPRGENSADVKVDSCPECGTVTDIEYGETDNPLLNHMECTFNSCMDIAVAKNEGYAGSSDPMANFNDSVRLGVPVPIGVALRLSDKWARLCRLLQTGENPLADESITDTIMDAVNYLAILLYALDTGSVETSTVTDKC